MYQLKGTIKIVKETRKVSDKFSVREFVVTEGTGMYPQDIMFQAAQDKCAMLDAFNENDQVVVSFNLRGREWTSPQGEVKYFNTLDAWRIEKDGQGMPQGGPGPMDMNSTPAAAPTASTEPAEDDDLPF